MFPFVNNNKQELQLNEQNMPKHIAIIMDENGDIIHKLSSLKMNPLSE